MLEVQLRVALEATLQIKITLQKIIYFCKVKIEESETLVRQTNSALFKLCKLWIEKLGVKSMAW